MVFGLEAKHYFAVCGEWKNAADDAKYVNWAAERIRDMEQHALGIRLADENLGRHPGRFTTDTKLARLDIIRAQFDPDGLFNPWMGRIGVPQSLVS